MEGQRGLRAEHQNNTVGEGVLEDEIRGANMPWHNIRAKIWGLIGRIVSTLGLVESCSRPALQVQRELQWFKAVEMCLEPSYKDMKNSDGKTPLMVFVEEHKQLTEDGEKWMKGKAQSCTIVASLIAAVVFAAGITVPGGTNDTGVPVFSDRKSFTIFIIATVASLFSSISSVLMF